MRDKIRALADRYAAELKRKVDERVADMEQDDRSHILIYQVKTVQGEYHYADAAWAYVKGRTGVDLLAILKDLAAERAGQYGK